MVGAGLSRESIAHECAPTEISNIFIERGCAGSITLKNQGREITPVVTSPAERKVSKGEEEWLLQKRGLADKIKN